MLQVSQKKEEQRLANCNSFLLCCVAMATRAVGCEVHCGDGQSWRTQTTLSERTRCKTCGKGEREQHQASHFSLHLLFEMRAQKRLGLPSCEGSVAVVWDRRCERYEQILTELPNFTFHQSLFSGSRNVTRGQTFVARRATSENTDHSGPRL